MVQQELKFPRVAGIKPRDFYKIHLSSIELKPEVFYM